MEAEIERYAEERMEEEQANHQSDGDETVRGDSDDDEAADKTAKKSKRKSRANKTSSGNDKG